MDINAESLKLGMELASYVGKNSVQSIKDRIRKAKTKGNQEETINELDEIISELIQDKSELITLAQAYDEQLMMRKISDDEVEYITESIVPIIEKLVEKSDDMDGVMVNEMMEIVKPLLSKDTFNILQMLGFNFKEAIGEPLTKLIKSYINAESKMSSEYQAEFNVLQKEYEVKMLDIIRDKEAYERYLEVTTK